MASERYLETKKLTLYEKQLKDILSKPCENPVLLAKSPLASSYFISSLLPDNDLSYSDEVLGKTLLKAIDQVTGSFWQNSPPQNYDAMKTVLDRVLDDKEHDHYHAIHLELRFFQKYLKPKTIADIYNEYLYVTGPNESKLFNATIRLVGQKLVSLLGSFSRHLPPEPRDIIDVEEYLEQLQTWLLDGQTVSLIGQGGIGKSSLAILLAHQWETKVFWYTVRPDFNDRLNQFLFALGGFLHQLGHSSLWKLVLVKDGTVRDGELAKTLLYEDLSACQTELPLFIVDEIDRLYSVDPDLARPQHIKFLEFLDEIRGKAPLLFVGQRAVLENDHHLELASLLPVQVGKLLHLRSIPASHQDVQVLHKTTRGNPRLILLCIALYESEQSGEPTVPFSNTIARISQNPGFGPVFDRLWDRLDKWQRKLLQQLSVYVDHAPEQYWLVVDDKKKKSKAEKKNQEQIEKKMELAAKLLIERRLVEKSGPGSVSLLPIIGERIYRDKLTPDERVDYHRGAADVLAEFSQYTDVAYHLDKGGQPAQAIQLWYPMMDAEIQRGQAGAAYNIFINMAGHSLPKREHQALVEIQARLHELHGEIRKGLTTIQAEKRSASSEQSARLIAIQGKFENALGMRDLSQESYKRSIEITSRLIAQNVIVYGRYGTVYVHKRELDNAEKIALAAEQELLILQGLIAFQRSQWDRAYEIFKKSLTIAQTLEDFKKMALCHKELITVHTRRGQFEDAIWHGEQAKVYYESAGDRPEAAKADHVLTATYFEMGNYEKSIEVGKRTIRFFENIKNPYFAANTCATVAEAYFRLGKYEQAEKVAKRVLSHKEPQAISNAYFILGLISEAKEKFQKALDFFKRSLDIAESNEDPFIEPYARRAYGKMLCEIDDKADKGIEQLRRALAQFEQIKQKQEVEATQKILDSITS